MKIVKAEQLTRKKALFLPDGFLKGEKTLFTILRLSKSYNSESQNIIRKYNGA